MSQVTLLTLESINCHPVFLESILGVLVASMVTECLGVLASFLAHYAHEPVLLLGFIFFSLYFTP